MEPPYTIVDGFPADQRAEAARLFWAAFRAKLSRVLKPEDAALGFLEDVASPSHALSALSPDGSLLGIAGFKTSEGAFIGGEFQDLRARFGWVGGFWRGLVLSTLERPLKPGVLLMDGIMVKEDARGSGIGSALLQAIKHKARALSCSEVRLDVIDTNPRARALYERQGFEAAETRDLGPLRHVFGFRSATQMTFSLSDVPPSA